MRSANLLVRAIAIGCLLATLLAGCGGRSAAPTATASPVAPKNLPIIGVSLPDVAATEITLIQKALADNQRKNAVSLLYRSADGKAEKQATDIADLVRLNIVGLIVLPVDTTLIAPAIAAVREKGIPVVAINALPIGVAVDTFVRPDYRANGREATKYVTDRPPRGTTLILATNDARGEDFAAGATDALAKANAAYRTLIVSGSVDLPAALPPVVRGGGVRTVLASDDTLAFGTRWALRDAGLLNDVAIIGHDGTRAATQAVLDGTLAGDVDIRPQDEGVAALGDIAALARKKQPASDLIVRVDGVDVRVNAVPGRLITRANVQDMQERWPDLVYTPAATPTPIAHR